MIIRMVVHLVHKPFAQRIFITLLTESVQQLLKLHRMMDQHFYVIKLCWELAVMKEIRS
jgi:hypothetical protein